MAIDRIRCDLCGDVVEGEYFKYTLEGSFGVAMPVKQDMCNVCRKKISSYVRHGLPPLTTKLPIESSPNEADSNN